MFVEGGREGGREHVSLGTEMIVDGVPNISEIQNVLEGWPDHHHAPGRDAAVFWEHSVLQWY